MILIYRFIVNIPEVVRPSLFKRDFSLLREMGGFQVIIKFHSIRNNIIKTLTGIHLNADQKIDATSLASSTLTLSL